MASGGKRGVKPLTARDWIFGSRPRRLLLAFVLSRRAPDTGWRKAELARGCGVSPHGGVDEHITGLIALGLLIEKAGYYWPTDQTNKLGKRVRALLKELDTFPERKIKELRADTTR